MNKILITGGRGALGQYFKEYSDCIITGKSEVDVTDFKTAQSYVRKLNPDSIIHLAAETDVDLCEDNPKLAYQINTEGTKNMAILAREQKCPIIYVSTAGVFSGKGDTPFTVNDKPFPVSIYANSKWRGEKEIQKIIPDHIIIRTGWVFGGFEKDNKFVGQIVRQIWQGAEKIKAVDDIFGCPTYGHDLVKSILDLVSSQKRGIFHIVNSGFASRFQIALEIAKILKPGIQVLPAKSSDFPKFSAPRPKFEVIQPSLDLRSWQAALKEYLLQWKALQTQRSRA